MEHRARNSNSFEQRRQRQEYHEGQSFVAMRREEFRRSLYVPYQDSRSTYVPYQDSRSTYVPYQDSRSTYVPYQDSRSTYQPLSNWSEFWSPNPNMIFWERTMRNSIDNTQWRERRSYNPALNSFVRLDEAVNQQTPSINRERRYQDIGNYNRSSQNYSRADVSEERYSSERSAEIIGEFMSQVEDASEDEQSRWYMGEQQTFTDLMNNMHAYLAIHSTQGRAESRFRERWNGLSRGEKQITTETIEEIEALLNARPVS
jgi:adenine-specific DNA methylase